MCLPSNLGGLPAVGEETWPVYKRLEELGMPVYIHPASNSMLYDRGLMPILDSSLGWVWDSSATALTMVMNGLLDHCPNLEVVHAHLGGVIPYVAGRPARYTSYLPKPIDHPLEHYFKTRFYVDTVTQTPAAFALARDFYGADRLVYGSDAPWHLHSEALPTVRDNMSEEEAHQVLHENRVATLRLP
jgi:predicted TIM-barrel fold metal-dependent hydrolase